MRTRAYPYVQIARNTLEIGIFDCGSVFLLLGDEKAMVIDTGVGLGDLHGFIRQFTDRPLIVCFTHNHMDHIGGAGDFDNAHIHPADMEGFAAGGGIGMSLDQRRWYVNLIARREKGLYPYRLDDDLVDGDTQPPLTPLEDGQVIDLGNRPVTVVACPGHTPGSVAFLDDASRSLFLGDACNCKLGLSRAEPDSPGFTSVEKSLAHLHRLVSLRDRYDAYYNGHYDFRRLGQPLGEDVLPDAVTACEQIVAGTAKIEMRPLPFAESPLRPVVVIGRTQVAFNPAGIREI